MQFPLQRLSHGVKLEQHHPRSIPGAAAGGTAPIHCRLEEWGCTTSTSEITITLLDTFIMGLNENFQSTLRPSCKRAREIQYKGSMWVPGCFAT